MRVNPNPMPDILAALNVTRHDQQRALLEMSSGRRVNNPSDDPAASAVLVTNYDQTTIANRYAQSVASLQGAFQTADSTLSTVITSLTRAITLGVEGANGTLSPSDRDAIIGELQGIQDQLVSLGNTSYQGRYLFSGTVTSTPPFAKDIAQPSGVRYDGNGSVNSVQIGDGYRIATNVPGSKLFAAAGHDVFASVNGLIQAMQSASGFDTAIAGLRASFDYVSAQRVFYGNAINQAQSQSTYLGVAKLQLAQQENTLAGADLEDTVSRLVNSQNSINATLTALGRVSQTSLFDYLK